MTCSKFRYTLELDDSTSSSRITLMKTYQALRLILAHRPLPEDQSAIMYAEHPETGELSAVRGVELIEYDDGESSIGLNASGKAKPLTVREVWRRVLSFRRPEFELTLSYVMKGEGRVSFSIDGFCMDGGRLLAVGAVEEVDDLAEDS